MISCCIDIFIGDLCNKYIFRTSFTYPNQGLKYAEYAHDMPCPLALPTISPAGLHARPSLPDIVVHSPWSWVSGPQCTALHCTALHCTQCSALTPESGPTGNGLHVCASRRWLHLESRGAPNFVLSTCSAVRSVLALSIAMTKVLSQLCCCLL
jgi:hypothetical protein